MVAWATSGGFWAHEGLDIAWIPYRGGVNVANAVLRGEVDGGYGTWLPCVQARRDGQPLKILASMAQSLAQNLVVNRTRIGSTADLPGKRWAVDGNGALSHTLGQLIVSGLGIPDGGVEWIEAGPPPERIAALLNGTVDCSLVRVEEAAVLTRQYPEFLGTLLGFQETLALAPVQPHGVISVTDSFARENPEVCNALVRGLIRASRSLHDNFEDFQEAVRQHVIERPEAVGPSVPVSLEEVQTIWQHEHDNGGFAVNGGLTAAHWQRSLRVYADLRGDEMAASLTLNEIAAPAFVADAISQLGVHSATHDLPDCIVPRPGTAAEVSGGSGEAPSAGQRADSAGPL